MRSIVQLTAYVWQSTIIVLGQAYVLSLYKRNLLCSMNLNRFYARRVFMCSCSFLLNNMSTYVTLVGGRLRYVSAIAVSSLFYFRFSTLMWRQAVFMAGTLGKILAQ